MEKPGVLAGDTSDTFSMVIPKQKEAVLKEVALDKCPEELSYIKRITIAQSDEMASVYVYFAPTRNTEFPVAFSRDGSSLEISTFNTDYIHEAFQTDNLGNFRIIDRLTSKVYEVDVKQGTFTLMDLK